VSAKTWLCSIRARSDSRSLAMMSLSVLSSSLPVLGRPGWSTPAA
jgi:hypothetical protein